MDTTRFNGNLVIAGNLTVGGTKTAYERGELTQEDLAPFPIDLTEWKVWDNRATNLPSTSATDDLGLYSGTFGTSAQRIATSDLKTAGATSRYAGFQYTLPECYVAGQTVQIRVSAGMLTTVADTSATIDFQAHLSNDDTTVGSDLVTTAAQSINSLTFNNYDFTITGTTLAPGDQLDIRMTIAVNDAAGATAVIAAVAKTTMLLDIKG